MDDTGELDEPGVKTHPWAAFFCEWLGSSTWTLEPSSLFGVRYVPPKRVRVQPSPDLLLAVDFRIVDWPWVTGRTLALDDDIQRRRTWTAPQPS